MSQQGPTIESVPDQAVPPSPMRRLTAAIALVWALFQLALPRLVILDTITVRAVHLAFALVLVFWSVPTRTTTRLCRRLRIHIPQRLARPLELLLGILASASALYIVIDWSGISARGGVPITRDIVISIILILLLLEAARRTIGPALSVIAVLFTLYAFFGPYMPSVFAYSGVSLRRYLSQIVLSTEGIYGIPLRVSASTVFLFVLLGSMLNKLGAGQFFNDLAVSLFGRFRGGAAKAAVVSSGLTGLVSGSSIANVVTTGTFTIPLMKKMGYPGEIAAATEVAASTNGQLMPPIMGAAAFIIAEYLSIPYLEVIKAAAVPAFVSYFALFYLVHLEAVKRRIQPVPAHRLARPHHVLKRGVHHLLPLAVLLYQLIVMRRSPELAAFDAVCVLVIVALFRAALTARSGRTRLRLAVTRTLRLIVDGLIAGSKNMLSVALATAAAGIVVGIVNMGIGSNIVHIVEALSANNLFLLLFITAITSLIMGMGLPTTATYIVMASVTVPVIVRFVGPSQQSLIPAIAAHLFCFYFGILADDTPPVGLAAYAAAAIARSDPIATGIRGFLYDLRTAVIPFMFVFNPELVLVGVDHWTQALLVFAAAVLGAFAFSNAVQGWFITKNKWFEFPCFLLLTVAFFCPGPLAELIGLGFHRRYYLYLPAVALYLLLFLLQRSRSRVSR